MYHHYYITSPLALGFLLLTPILATPIHHHKYPTLSPRSSGNPGIYTCSSPNWQGQCTWLEAPTGECQSIPWGGGSKQDISLGPDNGITCTIYAGHMCDAATQHVKIDFPGTTNLASYKLGAYKSLKCIQGKDLLPDIPVMVVPVDK